jgi:GT2 family glycosyltransferase
VRLSALVVAFDKDAVLGDCIDAVDAALAALEVDGELIVVLNQASSSTRERLSEQSGAIVEGGAELGYAGAVARGLERARGEWIALVNDDCILDPGALAELLAAGERSDRIGAVAAQIRFADRPDIVNSAGIELDDLGIARERRLGQPVGAVETGAVDVLGASGTLGLYRRAMLDELGGFDESFFAYLEDADLAWRARMAGWRCVLAPAAVAYHRHSATLGHGSAAKHLLVGRNRVRMLAKNATTRQLRLRLLPMVGYDVLYIAYVAATRRTLAPLTGRLRGLSEWGIYREAGRAGRRELRLPPSPGLRAALGRDRVYRAAPPG